MSGGGFLSKEALISLDCYVFIVANEGTLLKIVLRTSLVQVKYNVNNVVKVNSTNVMFSKVMKVMGYLNKLRNFHSRVLFLLVHIVEMFGMLMLV